VTAEPLLTPAQAAILLDQVVYEQILECIDLDEVRRVEQSLTLLVGELEGMSAERIDELARATLARALRRIPDEIHRYLRGGPCPIAAARDACEGFEDCEGFEAYEGSEAAGADEPSRKRGPAR
jgi:hypothetical protein